MAEHDPQERHRKLNRIGDLLMAIGLSMVVGYLSWCAVGELYARMGQ